MQGKKEKLGLSTKPTKKTRSKNAYTSPGSSYEQSTLKEPFSNQLLSTESTGWATKKAVHILRPYETYFRSPSTKLKAIKKGLPAHAITDLIEITGATQMDLAKILDLTEPTLRKHIKVGKELNTNLSEHILQLFELFDKGMDTFGSLEQFKEWLPHHNIGINARPLELLDTITGINIVMNELLRIDYGVLA